MLNLGMSEILLFAIITLIVLGPDKLPEAARFAGRWYGKIKRMISSIQSDIDRELRMSELREQMQQELDRIKHLEEKMQAQMAEMEKHDLLKHESNVKNDELKQSSLHTLKSFTLCEESKFKTPFLNANQPSSTSIFNLKKAV